MLKIMGNSLYYIFIIICSFQSLSCLDLAEGESCGSGTSLGICKKLLDCPSAITILEQTGHHSFQRCRFAGLEEIVCCPDFKNVQQPRDSSTSNLDRPPRTISSSSDGDRKSVAACKSYVSSTKARTDLGIIITEDDGNALPGEFPHMAQIGFELEYFANVYSFVCGGSLISNRFVLTTAHCLERSDGKTPSIVRLGFVTLDFPEVEPQERGVKSFSIHPGFNRRTKQNDIGLIELDSAVMEDTYSNISPACLYQESDNPTDLFITHWGSAGGEESSNRILQKARIQSVELNECSRIFEKELNINITNLQICCLTPNSLTGVCQAESGSPLQKLISENGNVHSIVGILSFGEICDDITPALSLYTRVSSYLDWIENIVWP